MFQRSEWSGGEEKRKIIVIVACENAFNGLMNDAISTRGGMCV